MGRFFAAIVIMMGFALGGAAGCATTPREQAARVQDVFIAVTEGFVEARSEGVIGDDTWVEVRRHLIAGDQLVDAILDATMTGDSERVESLREQLRRVIDRLIPFAEIIGEEYFSEGVL